MTDPDTPEWSFSYSGDYWVPFRSPAADDNLLRAVETMALSFRFKVWPVELALEAWLETANDTDEDGVNITTIAIRRVGNGLAEIRDKYGQFDNVCIRVEEVESVFRSLAQAIKVYSG
jgi:hypothetical protein